MRQIILDTETTGLSPQNGHRIIEVACLEMINRRLTNNHLHFYLNPERTIEKGAKDVHGISESFLQDKPFFRDIADNLLSYLHGAELIIHNAPFDLNFLDSEFQRLGKNYQTLSQCCTIVDTLILARRKHPGQQNNLDALCKRYHVNHSARNFHGALLDAELLAQVYLLMTGGQSELFEPKTEEIPQKIVSTQKTTRKRSLKVLYATAEENKAHEDFMQKIKAEMASV